MKQLGTIFAITTLASGMALADYSTTETSVQHRPALGIQAGMNFETAKTPGNISAETHTGYTVGLTMDVPVATNIAIAPELNYSRRGFDVINTGNVKAGVTYHSIEVPVLAKVAFFDGIRPYIFAGPMGVWNISNEVTGSIGGTGGSTSFNPRTFDLAAVGGVGVELGPVFVNARYVLGLLDIDSNSADYQSRGFKLLAGLHF